MKNIKNLSLNNENSHNAGTDTQVNKSSTITPPTPIYSTIEITIVGNYGAAPANYQYYVMQNGVYGGPGGGWVMGGQRLVPAAQVK
jgi:hypothetical protein